MTVLKTLSKVVIPLIFLALLPSNSSAQDSSKIIKGGFSQENKGTAFCAMSFNNNPYLQMRAGSGEMSGFSDFKLNFWESEIKPFISYGLDMAKDEQKRTEHTNNNSALGLGFKKDINDKISIGYQGSFANDTTTDSSFESTSTRDEIIEPNAHYTIDVTAGVTANTREDTASMNHLLRAGYGNLEVFLAANSGATNFGGNINSIVEMTLDGIVSGVDIHDYTKTITDTPISDRKESSSSSFGVSYYFSGPLLAVLNARSDALASVNASVGNKLMGDAKLTFKLSPYTDLSELIEPSKQINYLNFSAYNKDIVSTKTDLIKREHFKDTVSVSVNTNGGIDVDLLKDNFRIGAGHENSSNSLRLGYGPVDFTYTATDSNSSCNLSATMEF